MTEVVVKSAPGLRLGDGTDRRPRGVSAPRDLLRDASCSRPLPPGRDYNVPRSIPTILRPLSGSDYPILHLAVATLYDDRTPPGMLEVSRRLTDLYPVVNKTIVPQYIAENYVAIYNAMSDRYSVQRHENEVYIYFREEPKGFLGFIDPKSYDLQFPNFVWRGFLKFFHHLLRHPNPYRVTKPEDPKQFLDVREDVFFNKSPRSIESSSTYDPDDGPSETSMPTRHPYSSLRLYEYKGGRYGTAYELLHLYRSNGLGKQGALRKILAPSIRKFMPFLSNGTNGAGGTGGRTDDVDEWQSISLGHVCALVQQALRCGFLAYEENILKPSCATKGATRDTFPLQPLSPLEHRAEDLDRLRVALNQLLSKLPQGIILCQLKEKLKKNFGINLQNSFCGFRQISKLLSSEPFRHTCRLFYNEAEPSALRRSDGKKDERSRSRLVVQSLYFPAPQSAEPFDPQKETTDTSFRGCRQSFRGQNFGIFSEPLDMSFITFFWYYLTTTGKALDATGKALEEYWSTSFNESLIYPTPLTSWEEKWVCRTLNSDPCLDPVPILDFLYA